ncbi:MAG: YihY/virulence factor BrkB family protein [Candidatus Eisenbacteria bacterium]|nr:YihY/virulence factor BrkB family protein [Candidatus Eisenbacteria bacterium]
MNLLGSAFAAFGVLLRDALFEWRRDAAQRMAAALAFYTLISLAPLLVLMIAVIGFVFGREAVEGELVMRLQGLMGEPVARTVQNLVAAAGSGSSKLLATSLGLVFLVYGASAVFGQLHDSLNMIWHTERHRVSGWRDFFRARVFSLLMVLATGFLLLVSLLAGTAVTAATEHFRHLFPQIDRFWYGVHLVAAFGLPTLLFALIFKIIPDVPIAWRDAWGGAILTTALYSIGRMLLGIYLGRSTFTSLYGAAGSLVVLLFWIYYTAQILFLGAEFTYVYARRFGSRRGGGGAR